MDMQTYQEKNQEFPWHRVLLAVTIVVLLGFMFKQGMRQNTSAHVRTAATMGTITKITKGSDSRDRTVYTITAEFEDTGHRTFTAESERVSEQEGSKWRKGDTVKVAYDPSSPENNRVALESSEPPDGPRITAPVNHPLFSQNEGV